MTTMTKAGVEDFTAIKWLAIVDVTVDEDSIAAVDTDDSKLIFDKAWLLDFSSSLTTPFPTFGAPKSLL